MNAHQQLPANLFPAPDRLPPDARSEKFLLGQNGNPVGLILSYGSFHSFTAAKRDVGGNIAVYQNGFRGGLTRALNIKGVELASDRYCCYEFYLDAESPRIYKNISTAVIDLMEYAVLGFCDAYYVLNNPVLQAYALGLSPQKVAEALLNGIERGISKTFKYATLDLKWKRPLLVASEASRTFGSNCDEDKRLAAHHLLLEEVMKGKMGAFRGKHPHIMPTSTSGLSS